MRRHDLLELDRIVRRARLDLFVRVKHRHRIIFERNAGRLDIDQRQLLGRPRRKSDVVRTDEPGAWNNEDFWRSHYSNLPVVAGLVPRRNRGVPESKMAGAGPATT